MKEDKVLIIIPAYNEEKTICSVIEKMQQVCPEYDYVVINDGSKDSTSRLCRERGYTLVDLPVNLGLEGAFQTGMKYADMKGYAYAIQIDADGQHDPAYIKDMVKKAREGYDIVIGSRFETEKKPFSPRMLGSRLIGAATFLTTGKKLSDPTSGMRLYSAPLIHEFAVNMNYGPEPDTVCFLMKQGARVGSVQVTMKERAAGQSYLTFTRSISYMTRVLISILLINNFRKR